MAKKKKNAAIEGLPEPKGMRDRLDKREEAQRESIAAIESSVESKHEIKDLLKEAQREQAREAKPGIVWAFSRLFGWAMNPFLACLLSGVLIGLSFQPHNVPGLILVALVPMFLALPRFKYAASAFFGAYGAGVIALLMVLRYLSVMEAADGNQNTVIMSYVASAAVPAIGVGLFGLTSRFFQRRFPRHWWLLFVPIIWTGFEFWRFYLPAPFAPALAGYALSNETYAFFDVLIQIADLGSVLAVSLFVALINACIAVSFDADFKLQRPGKRLALIVMLLAFGSNVAYGLMRLEEIRDEIGIQYDGPVVAIVQPNLTQKQKNQGSPDQRWMKHWEHTQKALPDPNAIKNAVKVEGESDAKVDGSQGPLTKPDLIIWSETAVPNSRRGPFPPDYAAYPIAPYAPGDQRMRPVDPSQSQMVNGRLVQPLTYDPRRVAMDTGVPIIFGAHGEITEEERAKYYPYVKAEELFKFTYNRAYFIDNAGKIAGIHDKAKLVPFGEFIPYPETLGPEVMSEAEKALGRMPSILPGYRRDQFALQDSSGKTFRFTMNICYEYFFPDIYQELHSENPVHFTVTLSNEGWYFDSTELDQAMVMSKFRAIETRTTFVRATNSGVSAIIGPDGVETARLWGTNEAGERSDRLVEGVLTAPVPYLREPPRTFFMVHGMWLGWATGLGAAGLMGLALVLSVLMLPIQLIRGKRETQAAKPDARTRLAQAQAAERKRIQQEAIKRRAEEMKKQAAMGMLLPDTTPGTPASSAAIDAALNEPQGDKPAPASNATPQAKPASSATPKPTAKPAAKPSSPAAGNSPSALAKNKQQPGSGGANKGGKA